ncbi:MAG: hypothetical protein AAGC62_10200, partial [Pseudomonadota bacterium]
RGRGRGKSAEQDRAPAHSADSDEGKSKRSRRRGGRRDGDDRPVVGMGDHVPAFLLREVPLPSSSRRTAKKGSETSAEGPDAEELNAA